MSYQLYSVCENGIIKQNESHSNNSVLHSAALLMTISEKNLCNFFVLSFLSYFSISSHSCLFFFSYLWSLE